MNKIILYNKKGIIDKEYDLTEENLHYTKGMISKCTMKDKSEKVGFSDPTKVETLPKEEWSGEIKDTINLWTWKNLDEDKHELVGDEESKYETNIEEIKIQDIEKMECIMYSHPRWGGKLTNKFEFAKTKKDVEPKVQMNDEQEFTEYYESLHKTNRKDDLSNFENTVKLKGYLTNKPLKRKTNSGVTCATFTLAVKRNYANPNGVRDYDFINILCWRKIAEAVSEYEKDDFVELEGHLQTRVYMTEENEKRFVTEVYCIKIEKI